MKKYLPYIIGYIFYTVFYREDKQGFFVKKRAWVFIILSPLILPLFMLEGIINYINFVKKYDMHWINNEDGNKKLTFKQRLSYTKQLLS